ncbi:LAGLIDADG family homing endonuclease [Bradyrhizobium sp. th.b2]|uniref:LAGLIDADG family homing endonuclease n=1 Tax=Bradyrhizobium sp. th-b2 TaxID=172088 RepID=UPI000402BE55|nr:LAGLIDADG family homing endonuclease [Bradyrhizobium sp. th.b2]
MTSWREPDLAYAAGYLDGEGCFTVGDNWRIFVTCTNTCREAIEWLRDVFGGTVSGPSKVSKANWRPTFQWKITARQAATFIEALLPYLREKKPQAELLLQLQATMGSGGRVPPEVLAQRQALKEKVKELKRAN